MTALIQRNLKKYFKDKATVFFSMLGVLLIFVIVALFIGDVITKDIPPTNPKEVVSYWLVSTMIALSTLTVASGSSKFIIDDKETKGYKDIKASPISNAKIAIANFLSIYIITIIMTLVAFTFGVIYVAIGKHPMIDFVTFLGVFGVILLASFTGAALAFLVAAFVKTSSVFGAINALNASLVGFLTGGYSAMSALPAAIQWFVKLFPHSHANVLIRQLIVRPSIERGIENQHVIVEFEKAMGVIYEFGDTTLPVYGHVLFLIIPGIVLLAVGFWVHLRKKEN